MIGEWSWISDLQQPISLLDSPCYRQGRGVSYWTQAVRRSHSQLRRELQRGSTGRGFQSLPQGRIAMRHRLPVGFRQLTFLRQRSYF